ncbi:MAG: EAL domain-containing protein, partial [Hyphomicrobiales bacterium]
SAALRVEMPLAALLDEMAVAIGWDRQRKTMVTRTLTEWMSKPRISRTEWELADKRILAMECRPLPDGGAVVTFDDVTVERRTQSQVAFMAFHDPLTGLANRRALKTRMEEGFDAANRFKLLLIDLDRFKAVNDTFGHGVGDRLLVEVSKRVRAVAGETGFVARIGGDELAVLVYGDNVVAMAAANEIVAAIGRPFELQGHHLSIGCSIGLCCTDDAEDVDSLMQRADLALYEAKRQGRGRVFCYVPGMLEKVAERTLLEYDLRTAVEKEQLVLHYQPVFDLQTQRLVAFEALIRWNHPTRGMVSPADFIPLAEEAGSILGIGQWVLETACRQAAHWGPDIKIAVNVSPVQFRSPTLLVGITKALADAGLPAHRLEIELTETAIVEDGPQIARVLESLRNCGVTVAMDDFGTGYSSLAHFRDLPVDRIKIDRSFVDSAATDIHSMAVLKAITRLGQDVGISTLAEGVETEVQLGMLRAIGCDAAQGYHLGRPMLGADADNLVHQAS